jgi:hypothetical protein
MATASLVKPNIFVVADRLPQLDWVDTVEKGLEVLSKQ